MTARSIIPPFEVFPDTDGTPLESGYIYIGTANLDPVTNPITVYWDAALTTPVSQPIRTVGGFPDNSGPSQIYVNSDFSITVKNKNLVEVYTNPSQNERVSASVVTCTQGGTGAIERTALAKLQESVSIADFGAVGDGTDQTTKVKAAIIAQMYERGDFDDDFASLSGFSIQAGPAALYFNPGYYKLNELHVITGTHWFGPQRYAGASLLFNPQATDKSLITLHLTATSPPPADGYPTVTQTANGGFTFSDMTFAIQAAALNSDGRIFNGNQYVVDMNVDRCWFNTPGGGTSNEVADTGYPNAPHNTSIYRGYCSGVKFGPGVFSEGFCAVFDFPYNVEYTQIKGRYDQNKYVVRSRGVVHDCVINVQSGILGSPWEQQPSFLVHHDDTGQTAAALSLYTGPGFVIQDTTITCAKLTSATDPTTRGNGIRQGVFYLKTANGKNTHYIEDGVFHVSGCSTGTSANDPQTERQGAIIMDGPGRVVGKGYNLTLHGYNTVYSIPYGHLIKNMTDASAYFIIEDAIIDATEYDGISASLLPYGVYIDDTCTAGTIIFKNCTFLGDIQGCIYVEAATTATVIVENPTVRTTSYLDGSQTLNKALFPNGAKNVIVRGMEEKSTFSISLFNDPGYLTDNTATSVYTFTVPNVADIVGVYYVKYVANANLGDYYRHGVTRITVSRLLGENTTIQVDQLGTEITEDKGGQAITVLTWAGSAVTGAVGATQTIDLQITLSDGGNGGYCRSTIEGSSYYYRSPNALGIIGVERA